MESIQGRFFYILIYLVLTYFFFTNLSLSQDIHSKSYTEFEEKFRQKVYMENRHKIARHNARFQKGEVTFSMEMNHFGDLVLMDKLLFSTTNQFYFFNDSSIMNLLQL